MTTLDTLHYEGNLIDKIKELERRLAALEHTELSGVVGPTGPAGPVGAQGPDGAGSPAGAVEGDIVYYDATPEAAALNIGTATQLLQVNAGATAPEWVTAGAANLANRTRLLWVPGTECENVTDGTYENQVYQGWEMVDAKQCSCYGSFTCPSDFASTMTLQAVFQPVATGNVEVALTAAHGADGQAYNTHTESTGSVTEAVVATINDDMTAALALGSMAAGDVCVVRFLRYGANVNDTINDILYFVGFLVSYTADM